jgi:serine/threonine protein phosphatase PrpC
MAVALQWHVATNADEPVALATSRSAETGIGEKDVLLVVADCKRCQAHDARVASALARRIFDSYNARESQIGDKGHGNGVDSNRERLDIAHWLSDALIEGLKHAGRAERIPANGAASAATDSPIDPSTLAVVAAVIHHDTLFVARYGGGRVYLLRGGMLQNLVDETFATSHTDIFEPDLGQLDLAGEDRVLLCSDAFNTQLNDVQIKSVLRSTPSSRRAAQTLLEAATRDNTTGTIGLAVADYVTGRGGVFPTQPLESSAAAPVSGPRRGTYRSIAAIFGFITLIVGAALIVGALSRRGGGVVNGSNATLGTPAPNATLPALVAPITGTQTSEPAPTLTAKPTLTPANTPEPTATVTPAPTETPEPTATPTARPTRRPRPSQTPTPVPPTATPEPPTATAGPTEVPTITPVPPWLLNQPAQPTALPPPGCGQAGIVCPP